MIHGMFLPFILFTCNFNQILNGISSAGNIIILIGNGKGERCQLKPETETKTKTDKRRNIITGFG